MVEKYSGYRASNGKIFDTEREAHIEELDVWLINAGIENVSYRAQIVNAMVNDPDSLVRSLACIEIGRDTISA